MSRPLRHVARRASAVAVLVALVATACGREAVEVEAPDDADEAACQRLVEAVPDRVADQERREVTPEDAGAAWGDPPVVLTCGTSMPEEFDEFSRCEEVEGVGWFVPSEGVTGTDPVTITTIGWEPVVQVRIPAEHQPPAAAMVELAPAIKDTLELVEPCQ